MVSFNIFTPYLFQPTVPLMLPEQYQKPEWLPHFDSEGTPFPDKIINITILG